MKSILDHKKADLTSPIYSSATATLSFCILVIVELFLGVIFAFFSKFLDAKSVYYQSVYSVISGLGLFAVVLFFSKKAKEDVAVATEFNRFNPVYIIFAIFISFGIFFGFGFFNVLIADLFNIKNSFGFQINTWYEYLIGVFFIAVIPAFTEEAFFRGIFLDSLKNFNRISAFCLTGLFFALFHRNVGQLVMQFVFGFYICFLTHKSKSEIPAIIAHFLNNFIVISIMYFKINYNPQNPVFIIIGLAVLGIVSVFLFKGFNNGKTVKGETKRFFIPFGIFSVLICLTFILLGVIYA